MTTAELPSAGGQLETDTVADHLAVSPEVLDVMNQVLLEKFNGLRPHLPLLPIRKGEDEDHTIALHPIWVVETGNIKWQTSEQSEITPEMVIDQTTQYFGLKREEMRDTRRTRRLVKARHIAMYLARDLTDLSYPALVEYFGVRDHTTVMNGVAKVETKLQEASQGTIQAVQDLRVLIREAQSETIEKAEAKLGKSVVLLTEAGLCLGVTFELSSKDKALLGDYDWGIKWTMPITNPKVWRQHARAAFDQLRTYQNSLT